LGGSPQTVLCTRAPATLGACFVAMLALVFSPAFAGAATLSTSGVNPTYNASPGEVNNLTIEVDGAVVRFTDAPGTTIVPSGLCSAVANVGTCPSADVNDVRAFTGDMNDTINATASIPLSVGFVFIGGGDGNDTLISNAQGDTQMNGDDDFGTPGNDILAGGPGEQTMIGGEGNDVMSAGAGDDRLIIQDGDDVHDAGPGDDLMDGGFFGPDGPDLMSGGAGDDRVDLRSRPDGIYININGAPDDGAGCPGAGCEGDNVLPDVEDVSTGQGDDILIGSDASERLNTEDGDDLMQGLDGSDSMQSSGGADRLFGGRGEDSMFGGEGPDQFFGGAGDDAFNYEFFDDDTDRFSGGGGFDSISGFEDSSDPIKVSLNGVADDGFRPPFFTSPDDNVLADVEDAGGSAGPDILVGSARPNLLQGFGGRDRIVGRAGGDELIGDRGRDTLTGGRGRDLFDGGGGPDLLRSRDGRPDEVRCGSSVDRVKADRADNFGPDCDRVAVR
jgi:Ca2+-binding RTX toxin-like protein